MWNLNALAEKAKEAAARIEKQLDDSVGVKEDAAASTAASSSMDLIDEDDDFFADNHDAQQASSLQQQQQQTIKESPPPSATKLNVTTDEGDDFFGDEGTARQESEEVDFGDGGTGSDGWDEADDIPLDDDEENSSPVQQQEQDQVEEDDLQVKESKIPMPVPFNSPFSPPQPAIPPEDEQSVEADDAKQADEVLDDPKDDTIGPDYEPEGSEIEPSSVEQTEPIQNDSEILSADNALGEEDTNDNEIQEEDYIMPADAGSENQSQVDNEFTATVVSMPPPAEPQSQTAAPPMDDAEKQQFLATIAELESQLYQRESQLASKSDQITSLSLQYESETNNLRQVITETKEEAKKRIVRAKERVEEMQTKLADAVRRADAVGGSNHEQSDIIAALRAEGEQLARKQSAMEQSVRNAKGEARELQERLDIEKDAREKEETKCESLEKEVKSLKEELSSARKGESQSKKLEGELVAAKEESEKQRASNLGLEQQLKELKEENKSLKKEASEARDGAAAELKGESNKLRKERDDMLGDLESKLRTSEREANVREDALRHEVSELRKRWQDAVRRAEDLSMDVQHSTAPLLRQLESTERQNRARAAAWAELETKLRSDLEEHVIQLEKLTKERNDLVASDKRSQRFLKEKEGEITSSQETIDALSATIESLETKVEEFEEGEKKIKQDLVVAERKASEGVSKVRTEMMQTVVDSEERYRSQIVAVEEELAEERQRRGNLEKQLDELAESVAAAEFVQGNGVYQPSPAKEKKLRSATDQASILHDTLAGIDSDVDDDDDEENDRDVNGINHIQGQGSFAAVEQLSLGLKGAKVELEALRNQLSSSEETRESLSEELGEARQAVEKLPLFEQKVSDLTMEVKLKVMEIKGLQDDIADVRFLYRTQLDALLEEKVTTTPSPSLHMEEEEEKVMKKNVLIIDES